MIKFENLSKQYGDNVIFDRLSFTIPKKEVTAILGPSGCGKTTLLNMISGLDESAQHYYKCAYVFQDAKLLPWMTVKENINFVLKNPKEHAKHLDLILDILEIYEYRNNNVQQLSGGQRQRVNIARAFIYPADLILMDEPFQSLDYSLKNRIIKDFKQLVKEENKTILFVTHSPEEAVLLAKKIIVFSKKPVQILKEIKILQSLEKRQNINYFDIVKEIQNII